MSSTADPFGTADLRRVVLDAWRASPTRFREDANAEDLLASGGYAGRALVELAANGVDAAREQQVPARLRIRVGGGELRVANTGAPLTAAGVRALASLRASAKRHAPGSVGFFGVGFTAVLSFSSEPRVVSTTGGVRFDGAATLAAIRNLAVPELDHELALRGGHVPVLRLPWPTGSTEDPVPPGYDTEVRLPLSGSAADDVGALLADRDTFQDLLWALPDLTEIDLADRTISRQVAADGTVWVRDGEATSAYRVVRNAGELPEELLAGRPVEQRGRSGWQVTWVLALEAQHASSTIGAPTPTDEPLTVPARLVGTFPVDDTRRRLAPGPMCDHLLDRAAQTYLALVQDVEPDRRWRLLPVTGFPAGPVDAYLRAAIVRAARRLPLWRSATGEPVSAPDSSLLPGLGADGAALIGQAVPGLLAPVPAAAIPVLRELGTSMLIWSQASAALAGLDRPPQFWRQVYRAAVAAEPPPRPEELADIPVPLVGGRVVLGANGCLLPDPDPGGVDDLVARRVGAVVPGLRVVDPDAVHPLLERLGARAADAAAVLADPALRDRVGRLRRDLDDTDPDLREVRELARVVLDLLGRGGPGLLTSPGAAGGEQVQRVLDDLVLTDEDGSAWPAAELVLPDAPLAQVLAGDVERVQIENGWLRDYGADLLARAGVRAGFPVVTVADPTTEHERLPGLTEWADRADVPVGEPFPALADLDLVDGQRWPAALALIAGDRPARDCLAPSGSGPSFSAWWIARHALIAGHPPGFWRLPTATVLDGLFDPLPVEVDPTVARWIGVHTDLDSAAADPLDLLDRLADPDRPIDAARVPGLTAALVAAMRDRGSGDHDLPTGVRTLSGAIVDAGEALVLDRPWWVQVLPPDRLVPGGSDPDAVGRVLDLPLASEDLASGSVTTDGTPPPQARRRWVLAAQSLGLDSDSVELTIGGSLSVTVDGRPNAVRWWGSGGRFFSDGTAESLGRVAAWAVGRWAARHLAIAAAAGDLGSLAEHGIG